jgi:hypothetical protein
MPTSYTPSLRLAKPQTGELINVWGEVLNEGVFDKADYAIAGWLSLPVAANTTLTTSNSADDQARAAMIHFTGAGGFSVTIPSVSKSYILKSSATASIIVTTGSGTTVQVDNGDFIIVGCDGTNVYQPGYGGLGLKDYIAGVAFSSSGALPAVAGNAGKYVFTDGTTSYWKSVVLADLSDWPAAQTDLIDLTFALAFLA